MKEPQLPDKTTIATMSRIVQAHHVLDAEDSDLYRPVCEAQRELIAEPAMFGVASGGETCQLHIITRASVRVS